MRGSGALLKSLRRESLISQTVKGWRFSTATAILNPVKPPVWVTEAPTHTHADLIAAVEPVRSAPSLVRIGEFLFHERVLLIADQSRQEGSEAIRLITSVLEYDTTFRAVRNKVINFTKNRDPSEYAAMRAWLNNLAGVPPQAVDETALELAAELEGKLNAATKEIAELKAKLEAIRGAL